MKKIYFSVVLVILVVAGIIIYFNSTSPEKKWNVLGPNEQMLLERSYPDASFDYKAYEKSMYDVHRDLQHRASRSQMEWVQQGPGNLGGRFNCVAVHPSNPSIISAGAATGGIFKTTNAGDSWTPVFDEQPFLSIGAITIDETNPDIIWAGTGDVNISGFCYVGNGIYKSTDAGLTWTHMGLEQQYVISKIILNPLNSDIIYAGTMGLPFDRDENRGLYKSIDGGESWENILYASDESGVIDLVMNPEDPETLYAAMYSRIRNNHEILAFGEDSRIWKTIDGGDSWTQLSGGLPEGELGRIGLAMYEQSPEILYAVVTDTLHYVQGIYHTEDGGDNWNALDISSLDQSVYSGFGWYFGKIYVNPSNPDQIYILGVDSYTTTDDGATWESITPPWWQYDVHADSHHMEFINADRIILSTDGGLYLTNNNCASWEDIENIPANQVYHALENPWEPGDFWCGMQDNGTASGNADFLNSWQRMYGGDGFQVRFDPENEDYMYAETQYGGLVASANGGFDFYGFTDGIEQEDRINWDMPYIISHNDPSTMYLGTHRIYKNQSAPFGIWAPLSGDLTDGVDEEHELIHTITCISESAQNPGIIYAGTADANVWRTLDYGEEWENITEGLPERYVTTIEASPDNEDVVYVTHSGYRDNEYIPHVHRSDNNGETWTDISGDLPQVAVNDILIMPGNDNLLFVATDDGVYYTESAGISWIRLGNNMPMMPVFDIEFSDDLNLVVASTFARSVQTIDITELTQVGNAEISGVTFELFPNPSQDILIIKGVRENVDWNIYSSAGETVLSGKGDGPLQLNVQNLVMGTYLISIHDGNKIITKKFIRN